MSDDQEAWPHLQAADRLANEVLRPFLGKRSMAAIPAARAVVDALRADPEFAAAILGGEFGEEWATLHPGGTYVMRVGPEHARESAARSAPGTTVIRRGVVRVIGPWEEAP